MHAITALPPIIHARIRAHGARTLGNRRRSDHGAGSTAVTVEEGEFAVNTYTRAEEERGQQATALNDDRKSLVAGRGGKRRTRLLSY